MLLVSFPAHAWGQKPDEEALFSIGAQAYQDGLLDLARDQLQAYLVTYPHGKHRAEVSYLLGDYFHRKRDFAQSTRHLQEVLQGQLPEALRPNAQYLLGRNYAETGDYPEAIRAFQPLIDAHPGEHWHEEALYWVGDAWLNSGDFERAADALRRLLEGFPNSAHAEHALYALGYACQRSEAHEQGLQAFQQLLARFPQSEWRRPAEYGAARALVSLQRFAEAAPYWAQIRKTAPSQAKAEEATFWWAESWMRAGQCDEARPAFQEYLTHFPQGSHDVDALDALATCAHNSGDFTGEVTALEALLQQDSAEPWRSSMMLRLAAAYEHTDQLKPAQALYSQWLLAFPDHPQHTEVLMHRGMISRRQRDYAQAIQDFAAVLQTADDARQRDLAHAVLAESYFQLNDCQAAQPHLTAVIGQGDRAVQQQARFRRGTCAYRHQTHTLVAEDFGALVDDADFRGDRQALLLPLGYSLAALQRDTEAVARFRQFLASDPPPEASGQALVALGASLLRVGQVGEALSVYEQLLTAAPDLSDKERLHLQLGLLYRQRQELGHAKRHFEAAVAGGEETIGAEALYQWSDLLLEEEATEQATAMLQELTRRFASQARWVGIASYRLALLHEAAERWPEAWQAYRAAVTTATDPKLVEAARERAQHLEETVDVHARREPDPVPDGDHL